MNRCSDHRLIFPDDGECPACLAKRKLDENDPDWKRTAIEARKYADLILERAERETSNPAILMASCYILLKRLAKMSGKTSEEIRDMFVNMSESFGLGHRFGMGEDDPS